MFIDVFHTTFRYTHSATLSSIELHWAHALSYNKIHWAALVYIELHQDTLSCIELHWDTLSYIELTLWATLSYSREAISWLSGAVTGSTHRIPHPFNCISWMHFSTVFLNCISQIYFSNIFLHCISDMYFSLYFSNIFLLYISHMYFLNVFLKCISQM